MKKVIRLFTVQYEYEGDPCVVCGQNVAGPVSETQINHHGTTVHLCGPRCREFFAADPEAYLAQLPQKLHRHAAQGVLRIGFEEAGMEA